jgi:UDP-galactopyranose mutase
MKVENLIVGAGLSGLSAAYHLGMEYLILEKESRAGGLCRTMDKQGFLFDHGPHILFTVDPCAARLIRRLLEANFQAREREAWIHHKKYATYTRFPFQAHLHGLPTDVVSECLVSLFEEMIEPEKKPMSNYREWMRRTFGEGICKHLMVPYAEKLWTVSPETMNFEWIERRVPTPPVQEIVRGALSDCSRRIGFNNEYWYPIWDGIEALPRGFLEKVKEIRLESEVTAIFPSEHCVEVNGSERIAYGKLLSTLPLPEVIRLIRDDIPPGARDACSGLEHNSILVVNLGIDREDLSPIHWCYFYEPDFCFHRISFPRNFSKECVPDGCGSISMEIAHSRHRKIDRQNLVARVVEELKGAGILTSSDRVVFQDVINIHYAYIIYDLDHRKNVDCIHRYLKSQDIIPFGRFGKWEYFNMDHSIMDGRRTSMEIRKEHGLPQEA